MATSYTTLLGFALPADGELDGAWGTTMNGSITELVEDAIAATAAVSVTAGNYTLSTTGSGATNEARCAILRATGTPGTTRSITAPAKSKAYIVDNQSDSIVTIKALGTTGANVAAGSVALVVWDGSDFVRIDAAAGGSDAQVQYNSSGELAGSANLTFNGTTLTAAGLAGPLNGTVGAITPAAVTGTTITANTGFSGPLNGTVGAGTPAAVTGTTITANTRFVGALDGTVGATTPAAIVGTTITANTGFSGPLNGTVGAVTPAAITGTTITANTGFSGPLNGTVGAGTPAAIVGTTIVGNTSLSSPLIKAMSAGPVSLYETTNTYNVGLKASNSMTVSYTLTMPVDDGTSGQMLTTDGSGVLSWTTPAAGVTLSGTNTWTGTQTFTNSLLRLLGSSTGYTTFTSANSSATNYTVTFPAENMTVGFRNVPSVGSKTSSYTLAVADVGKYVTIGGASGFINIPNSTFAAGDVITIYNNTSSAINVTTSTTTAYLAGTTTNIGGSTFSLAARGLATVLFTSATACVISGNVS